MKVRTLAALCAAGMLFASASVWSLTEPGPGPAVAGEPQWREPVTREPASGGLDVASGGTLSLEGRLGHARLAAARDNESFVLFSLKASPAFDDRRREPLNLSIVLDRSGSMAGQRLANALAAARGTIARLSEGDTISVVLYAQAAEMLIPPTAVDASSRERALAELGRVSARGDTCISCGLEAAFQHLRGRAGGVRRILLLSDGEATTGVRDVEGFRRLAEEIGQSGVSVTTVGVDLEYNERVMAALAQASNGRHHFVETPGALPAIFEQEFSGLSATVARDARLEVEPAPGVELLEVVDRGFERRSGSVSVRLGDFSAGDERTVLVRVRVPSGAPGERPLVEARLRYDDLLLDGPGSWAGKLSVTLTDDPAELSPLDPLVEARLQRSETASVLKEANRLFAEGKADAARAQLDKSLTALRTKKSAAVRAAPRPRARELEADFERQEAALGGARDGFATPPAGIASSTGEEADRKGRAQVRQNQKSAVDLAF
jgi:Ca-activated chloride channel family protein